MKICLFGATGLIGSHLLTQLQEDLRIHSIICPVRKIPQQKNQGKVQFIELKQAKDAYPADAILVALGTTKAQAGSIAAQESIDRDLVIQVAHQARNSGCLRIGVVSSMGANEKSYSPYLRMKGQMEREVAALGFSFVSFLQPSLLLGARKESRLAEGLAQKLLKPIAQAIPRTYRPIEASIVAQALIEDLFRTKPGLLFISNKALTFLKA